MNRAALISIVATLMVSACSSGSSHSPSPSAGRAASSPSPPISTDWIEYHRDASRTGVGPDQPALGNAAVAWKASMDADVYASPLIVAGHVIVATENNTVYSLDLFTGSVIWKIHLGDPVDASTLPCGNIRPITGITGTPAVDPSTGRLYVVAYMRAHQHILFALSLVDGSVVSQAIVDPPGSSPIVEQQRGALAIGSRYVYIPFGGLLGDCGAYHGDVVAISLAGTQRFAYQVPSGQGAGIWDPPGATIAADGSVYVVTGNATSSPSSFGYSDSVLQLSPDVQTVRSYFAPSNWQQLNASDTDLGSNGVALLRDGLAFVIGKDGVAYALRAGALGGIGGQLVKSKVCGGVWGGTSWSDGTVYVPCSDGLYALSVTPSSVSVVWHASRPVLGSPIVTAGAVWAIDPGSGTLYALDGQSGSMRYSLNLGSPAMHFSTPAATDGFVVAPDGRQVVAVSVLS